MPRMGRNIVTAGSTVQSITHNIDAILDIFSSLSFHSSHLPPPDFFMLASSSEEDAAVEDRTPIITLGLLTCAQPPLQGVGRPLLFGERPAADGRFASITFAAFGRTIKFGAEKAREDTGRKQETRRREGTNKGMRLSLFNIRSCCWFEKASKVRWRYMYGREASSLLGARFLSNDRHCDVGRTNIAVASARSRATLQLANSPLFLTTVKCWLMHLLRRPPFLFLQLLSFSTVMAWPEMKPPSASSTVERTASGEIVSIPAVVNYVTRKFACLPDRCGLCSCAQSSGIHPTHLDATLFNYFLFLFVKPRPRLLAVDDQQLDRTQP